MYSEKIDYSLIFERVPTAILIINDLKIVALNEEAMNILAYDDKKELIGKSLVNISPKRQSNGKMSVDFIGEIFEKITMSTTIFELTHLNKYNQEVYLETSIRLFSEEDSSFVVSWKDISDEKKLETKLRYLIDNLSIGVVVHAADTSILMNNPKASELLGLSNEQLRGMEAIDPRWKFIDGMNKVIPVNEYPVNKIIQSKKEIQNMLLGIVYAGKESTTWVLVNGFPIINNQNQIIEIVINFIDVTELKQKDELLIAQSRNAAMGEMISMIAHQWRQPLSAISMGANNLLVQIALGKLDKDKVEKYSNRIIAQTKHLSKTIDDFRSFFKPDKKISQIDIKEVIENTLTIVEESLKSNDIELDMSFETDQKVKAYPRELMQVFINIINNAKDAIIKNREGKALISIRVYENGKYVNIDISDTGGGIKADMLPKIFDPYFSTKDEQTGTGLGLYMSKMIIEKHLNGILDVSNKDKGTCFCIGLLR